MIKDKLYSFDPVIYPRKLWILYRPSLATINKYFLSKDGSEYSEEGCDDPTNPTNGEVAAVRHRDSGFYGGLIILRKKPSLELIFHEGIHFCDYLYEEIGALSQSYSNKNEPYAYLAGWVGGCFESILNDKIKWK